MKKKRQEVIEDGEQGPALSVTDIDAIIRNARSAVYRWCELWTPLPVFSPPCEIFSIAELRDAMGLHRREDFEGDPWPAAEELLAQNGFGLREIAGIRGVIVRRREECVDSPDDDSPDEYEDFDYDDDGDIEDADVIES